MQNKEVNSILILNKFLTIHQKNKDCSFMVRKIMSSKIDATLKNKPNLQLPFWIISFIFAGRSGLWS